MRRLIPPMLIAMALAACQARDPRMEQAKTLIAAHCAACHRVPGVAEAVGRVGPSLEGIGKQQVIAGHFDNNRATMIRWIAHPQQMLPGDAMQDPGVTDAEAKIIADYLYTLD